MTERIRGRKRQERNARLLRENPFCRHCKDQGRYVLAKEVDHIIPLSKDGSEQESNLQTLCVDCHQEKTREDMGYKAKPRIGLNGWPILYAEDGS